VETQDAKCGACLVRVAARLSTKQHLCTDFAVQHLARLILIRLTTQGSEGNRSHAPLATHREGLLGMDAPEGW
jgi:hypothetical protein